MAHLNSWSLHVIRTWSKYMTFLSSLRYLRYSRRRATGTSTDGELSLLLTNPVSASITIRKNTTDDDTLSEVIVQNVYGGVLAKIRDAKFIIDMGANIGFSTLYFAAHYPESRIVSIEPDPRNYALLLRNTSHLIHAGRCLPMRRAVWSSSVPLAIRGASERTDYNGIQIGQDAAASDAVGVRGAIVEGVTVCDILAQTGFPVADLLKIDIEGAEIELFSGDVSWLSKVRGIAIEFHGDSRRESGFDHLMAIHGFAVDDSHHHTVLAIRSNEIAHAV